MLGLVTMHCPINLDDQPPLHTTEVDDEPVNRMLPAEFRPSELAVTQVLSEYCFSRCLCLSELGSPHLNRS